VTGGGVTVAGSRVRVVFAVFPASEAVIVTGVATVTAAAVTVNPAIEVPAGTWTLAGTIRDPLELESGMVVRTVAGPLSSTSQAIVPGPVRVGSAQNRMERTGGTTVPGSTVTVRAKLTLPSLAVMVTDFALVTVGALNWQAGSGLTVGSTQQSSGVSMRLVGLVMSISAPGVPVTTPVNVAPLETVVGNVKPVRD
jgi:hypothetical protein